MRPSHLIIILLGIYSCDSAWECNKGGGSGESSSTGTSVITGTGCNLAKPKQAKCECVAEYQVKYKSGTNSNGIKPWCSALVYLIERARFTAAETNGINKEIKLGVQEKPRNFNDPIDKYEKWNNAANTNSHYFLDKARRTMCQKGYRNSNGDEIYEANYKFNKTSTTFNPIPGKNVIYFQLAFECATDSSISEAKPGNTFRVYMDNIVDVPLNDTMFGLVKMDPCKIPLFDVGKDVYRLENGCEADWVKGSY